jgi:hypothetical protein
VLYFSASRLSSGAAGADLNFNANTDPPEAAADIYVSTVAAFENIPTPLALSRRRAATC